MNAIGWQLKKIKLTLTLSFFLGTSLKIIEDNMFGGILLTIFSLINFHDLNFFDKLIFIQKTIENEFKLANYYYLNCKPNCSNAYFLA